MILKNSLFLILGKVVTLGLGLVYFVFLAKEVGDYQFGVFSFCLAIAALLSPVMQVGLNSFVTKELVRGRGAESKILGTTLFIRCCASILVIVMALIVLIVYGDTIDYRMLVFVLLLSEMCKVGAVFMHGLESIESASSIAKIQAVVSILFTILKLFLIFLDTSIIYLAWLHVAESILISYLYYIVFKAEASLQELTFSSDTMKEYLRSTWFLVLSGFSAVAYFKIDQIMIANILGFEPLGVYSLISKFSECWFFVPALFVTALFPKIIKSASGPKIDYEMDIQFVFDILLYLSLCAILSISIIAYFILPFIGESYLSAYGVLLLHLFSGIFISLRALVSKLILIEDLLYVSLLTQLAGLIVNLILNLVFIPLLGLYGAALATLISYAVSSYFSLFFISSTRSWFRIMSGTFIGAFSRINKNLRRLMYL